MERPEPSDWDKFASDEYEILVAEENANDEPGYVRLILTNRINSVSIVFFTGEPNYMC